MTKRHHGLRTDGGTKYGDMIEDHEWKKPEAEGAPDRTTVKSHNVDVIYVTDPNEDMGYGREKYTAHVAYEKETNEPYILRVVEHRWKGNYWRDVTDWDFNDIPEPVRQQVAAVLPVANAEELDSDVRVIDEGGESRWKKYHKPAIDNHSGGEDMWAESYLKEAVKKLDYARENLSDESHEDTIADLVTEIQEVVTEIKGGDNGD